jgi:hypothetical protein
MSCEGDNPARADEDIAGLRDTFSDRSYRAQGGPQGIGGAYGVAWIGRVAAEHLAGDLIQFASQSLQHIGATINDRLEQGREHAHVRGQGWVTVNLVSNVPKRGQLGKSHSDEDSRGKDEPNRRQECLRRVALGQDRRAEIDHPMIDIEAACGFDLAQCFGRRDPDVGPVLDKGFLLVCRLEQVDPDDLARELRRGALAH